MGQGAPAICETNRRRWQRGRTMTTAAHIAQSNSLADLAAPIKTEHETVIRAELFGSDECTAAGLTISGRAPVLALCRQLIADGHDPGLRSKSGAGQCCASASARLVRPPNCESRHTAVGSS